jgi:hypothetical protein
LSSSAGARDDRSLDPAAAVWQAVGNGLLFPFAATYMKIYACTSVADQRYWLARVRDHGDIYAFADFDLPSYRSVSVAQTVANTSSRQ